MLQLLIVLLLLCGSGLQAFASGPRFIPGLGPEWGVPPWAPVSWTRTTVNYFTDPGDLNAQVQHADADAMVAAAAAVWTTPSSTVAYAQGGTLAEHVSTANTSFNGSQVVFPADVQQGNENNVPIAIVYDTDGGVIDLLLGDGASAPDSCAQNAVVGDVDDIHTSDGSINHATLILNGRCVGDAPEQLTQMQYLLARQFGRVLGLAWSQVNDNVFTAQTTVTANQMAYWPVLHPIDVICGNYTYQCLVDPFRLRVDDLNALASLYAVPVGAPPPGKEGADTDALWFRGRVYFPTGQGMDWVNVVARRENNGYTEDWETAATITGFEYQQAVATPVSTNASVDAGFWGPDLEGFFNFRRIPLNGVSDVFFATEPINPLYSGAEALGPYVRPPAVPSGSPASIVDYSARTAGDSPIYGDMVASDAAASCDTGADGTESAPAALDSSGWQTGRLCGWGHNSWWSVPVAAGHAWTMEVTATDETGTATAFKAQPVMGMWNASDATGTAPTVASQAVPLNAMSLGMTQIQMGSLDNDSSFRVSISDQFGAGRPDFTYTARVLYAATVAPATVGSGGGQIVVTGTGFRQGNQVLVNGAPARVLSWSATQIVADAPTMDAAGAQVGAPVEVAVFDADTGGSATMPDGLTYTSRPNLLVLVSAPAALETGMTAGTPFAVRVVASDGLSPVAGVAVQFSVTGGQAQLGVCAAAQACTAVTDAQGLAQTTVAGGAAGTVSLQAADPQSGASAQVTLTDTDPVRTVVFVQAAQYMAAGASGNWRPVLQAQQDGAPAANLSLTWTTTGAAAGALTGATNPAATDDAGTATAQVSVSGAAAGTVATLTGCAWLQVCASWNLIAVDPSQWVIGVPGGTLASVPQTGTLPPVTMVVTDLAGHVLAGAPVSVYQRVLAWEGDCSGQARCPAAPVLATSQDMLSADNNGQVQVSPLAVDGVPQVLQIAAATGTQGFVTVTLVKTPVP